ncbi:cupin domain-containing protein [Halomicroarcula sp. GCM10025324]|uniref:cupin domain-containing protein n=1 Tax=Haloarcula TaxID=2237 RepID=UPI0023E7E1BA|nr:cupin domain-containing protein [Halomicroarcula sp. ZS-22-S1]
MAYHHIDVEAIEPTPERPCTQRSLSDAAGLTQLGAHVYEVAPGEQIPLAYHYHDQQEELFYVMSGTIAVETPDETFSVGTDEAFAVEPESPQRASVPESADGPARILVVGAPAVDDAHAYDGE